MKICIVTRMDYNNYGNRLQNYALKKFLDEKGWDSLSGLQVYSKTSWAKSSNGIKKIIKTLMPFFLAKKYILNQIDRDRSLSEKCARRIIFKQFTDKYISALPPLLIKNDRHLYRSLNEYSFDYYIAGSDQVWNPKFSGRDYEFLSFAPYNKRLSFAASFGVSDIPNNQRARYTKLLKKMRIISVRESQGVKIAKELTGRNDIILTLDPTLLIERNEWEKLISSTNMNKPDHYIATYFLGDVPDAVKILSKDLGLPLIEMNCKYAPDYYNISPIEFISVIRDADYILTDSFHAMAFSLKFHKEFYVFRRNEKNQVDMFSRLEDLLIIFRLTNRIQVPDKVNLENKIENLKWEEIDDFFINQKNIAADMLEKIITKE